MMRPEIPGWNELITEPNLAARKAARARQLTLTKPAGALGRLEDLSIWLAGVQGRCPTTSLDRVRLVVFAADHGVALAGVSAYPAEVTAQMVANMRAGGAAVNVLAELHNVSVRVVDLGVGERSTGRIDIEDALTVTQVEEALLFGASIVDEEVDAGADLLLPGDMGIGNTTPATTVIAVLTGTDSDLLVGRGTGINEEVLVHKRAVIAAATARGRAFVDDPVNLMACVGGPDFAAMTGFLLQAAARRTPVILDGIVSGAAALLASRIAPAARRWWIAGHVSAEPAHRRSLSYLDLEPLLDLGLRLGEGTGALLALPLLRAAEATLTQMATFDSAGVSNRA